MNKNIDILTIALSLVIFVTFTGCNKKTKQPVQNPTNDIQHTFKSNFNEDSAYLFIKQQVDFGPRVPGSYSHEKCADFLCNKLSSYCDTVIIQNFKTRVYTGKIFDSKNFIGVINPQSTKRVLLCAHWDSRPFADQDSDKSNHNKPIDGANDGASGVGILLETARQLAMNKPDIGIDIVFFDIEDYGPPQDYQSDKPTDDDWGLGAQYWSKNPHVSGYSAMYGILLDMVGNSDPQFLEEQYSQNYAPNIINKVWNVAEKIGYGNNFVHQTGGIVTDDHIYVNENANIPTIDIIHQNFNSPNGLFYENWHTTKDNMEGINAHSLKIVGDVLLTTIMQEK